MGPFKFLGSLLGNRSLKKGSRRAEAAILAASEKAIAENQRQFGVTQANFEPFLQAGRSALGAQGDLMGINGTPQQQTAIDALKASPLYQSIFRNGEETLLQNGSATGGMRGGNMQRGLADFGADTLSSVIQQQLAQLGGMSGMGLGATGDLGRFGAANAGALSNLYGVQGSARAGGALQRAAINSSSWNNAGAFLDDAVQRAIGAGAMPGGQAFSFSQFLGGQGPAPTMPGPGTGGWQAGVVTPWSQRAGQTPPWNPSTQGSIF